MINAADHDDSGDGLGDGLALQSWVMTAATVGMLMVLAGFLFLAMHMAR
jgi:hypothetical protein